MEVVIGKETLIVEEQNFDPPLGGVDFQFEFDKGFLETQQQLQDQERLNPVLNPQLTRWMFGSQNSFWHSGRAKAFWIKGEGQLILFSSPSMQFKNSRCVYFGFFSCRNRASISHQLFARAEEWARGQKANCLLGPINMKTLFDYRLRTSLFSESRFWGEPQNPEYFVHLLQDSGLKICQNYFTDFIEHLEPIRAQARRRLPEALAQSLGIQIRTFNFDLFVSQKSQILKLVNDLFASNSAFLEINETEFGILYSEKTMAGLCRDTSFLLYDSQNNLIGLCMSFPHPQDSKCLLIKTIGIRESHRLAGRSFVACLQYIFCQSQAYDRIAFCLMTDDNLAHRLSRKYCTQSRSYALFAKEFD